MSTKVDELVAQMKLTHGALKRAEEAVAIASAALTQAQQVAREAWERDRQAHDALFLAIANEADAERAL